MYSKEQLSEMILHDYEKFNSYRAKSDDEIDLTEMDFSNATIENVDFTNCDLSGTTFADTTLSLINFTDANLESVDFTRANIVECDFWRYDDTTGKKTYRPCYGRMGIEYTDE